MKRPFAFHWQQYSFMYLNANSFITSITLPSYISVFMNIYIIYISNNFCEWTNRQRAKESHVGFFQNNNITYKLGPTSYNVYSCLYFYILPTVFLPPLLGILQSNTFVELVKVSPYFQDLFFPLLFNHISTNCVSPRRQQLKHDQ